MLRGLASKKDSILSRIDMSKFQSSTKVSVCGRSQTLPCCLPGTLGLWEDTCARRPPAACLTCLS